MMFDQTSPGILNYNSNIAIVLYGDSINYELITQSLGVCREKFKSHINIMYFYELTSTSSWENLSRAAFKKRKFEINNRNEFHYVIAINVKNTHIINILNFNNITCSDFSLHYFSGFYNTSSYKTSINNYGFYCISRIFDVVAKFFDVKEKIQKLACTDSAFGDGSEEHVFYYYLKTLNLKTYCPHPLLFKEIKK